MIIRITCNAVAVANDISYYSLNFIEYFAVATAM